MNTDTESNGAVAADHYLLMLNFFIVFLTITIILVANIFYRKDSSYTTLKENSFLTTEWRLLKTMKEQTDRLLQEKDQEISALRTRYLGLLKKNPSSENLSAMEAELRRAQAERQKILSSRYGGASSVYGGADSIKLSSTVSSAPAAPVAPQKDGPLSTLLIKRLEALEQESEVAKVSQTKLEEENQRLRAELAEKGRAPEPVAEPVAETAARSDNGDGLPRLLEAQRALLNTATPALTLEDIRTRTLLRAILRSPAIRKEYPTMVEDLDRYFELYGAAERLKGKREALDEALQRIGADRGQ